MASLDKTAECTVILKYLVHNIKERSLQLARGMCIVRTGSQGRYPAHFNIHMCRQFPSFTAHHHHPPIYLFVYISARQLHGCYYLPTLMTLASGGSPMFPLVVHQPAPPSIWPAVQSIRRVCPQIQGWQYGAYVGAVEEMMCVNV